MFDHSKIVWEDDAQPEQERAMQREPPIQHLINQSGNVRFISVGNCYAIYFNRQQKKQFL